MNTFTHTYSNTRGFIDFVEANSIKTEENILVQVFSGQLELEKIKEVHNAVVGQLPQAAVIGSTTSGEIINGCVQNETIVISVSVFENTKVKSLCYEYEQDSFHAGEVVAQELIKDDTRLLITFTDFTINGEEYVQGIGSIGKNVPICGGLAADNRLMTKTYVFTEDKIVDKGVVAVSLSGDIQVINDHRYDWQTLGKALTVTKSEKNRLYKVDGMTIKEAYVHYLGGEVAAELPMSSVVFPIIIDRGGVSVARAALQCHDDGSISFAGNVNVGDKVRFGYGNPQMILNTPFWTDAIQDKAESIFVYSCMARKILIGDAIQMEIEPLQSFAPTSGFFTYGEFFHSLKGNELLNQTMTFVALSESEAAQKVEKIEIPKEEVNKEKKNYTLRALFHLVNVTSQEIYEKNESLEEEVTRRKETEYELQVSAQKQVVLNSVLNIGMKKLFLKEQLEKILDTLLDFSWLSLGKKGGMFLYDPDAEDLILTATRGMPEHIENRCSRIALNDCYCGKVAVTKKMIFVTCKENCDSKTCEGLSDYGYYSIPIVSGDDLLGVMLLYVKDEQGAKEDVQEFLESVATTVANIIYRKKIEDDLHEHKEHLEHIVQERTQDLEESREQYRGLVQNVPVGLFRTSIDGDILMVNEAFTRILGFSSKEEFYDAHKNIREFYESIEDRDKLLKKLAKKERVQNEEITFKRKDGERIVCSMSARFAYKSNGEVDYIDGVFEDITKEKQANTVLRESLERLQEIDRMKNKFISIASHELRTPMTVVKTYSHLLLEKTFGDLTPQQQQFLEKMHHNTELLINLVNDMLDISKLEAGKMNLENETLVLAEAVQKTVKDFEVMFEQKGVEFVIDWPDNGQIPIFASERGLDRILTNLFSNALKFTPEGGNVTLYARKYGHKVEIGVQDTGIGIPKENIDTIFEKFSQVESPLQREYDGTGLGLAIVKGIVEKMGGEVFVESEAGAGAKFYFTLPIIS